MVAKHEGELEMVAVNERGAGDGYKGKRRSGHSGEGGREHRYGMKEEGKLETAVQVQVPGSLSGVPFSSALCRQDTASLAQLLSGHLHPALLQLGRLEG